MAPAQTYSGNLGALNCSRQITMQNLTDYSIGAPFFNDALQSTKAARVVAGAVALNFPESGLLLSVFKNTAGAFAAVKAIAYDSNQQTLSAVHCQVTLISRY